jgi:type IV secretory pathway VirD2 relaxase
MHDGADARMFDARSDVADEQAFSERCRDDRHQFRIIVSREDAAELESLRTFTRELMADAEHDLGTKLDWVAVDHWNTDNPHVHILIRGRAFQCVRPSGQPACAKALRKHWKFG